MRLLFTIAIVFTCFNLFGQPTNQSDTSLARKLKKLEAVLKTINAQTDSAFWAEVWTDAKKDAVKEVAIRLLKQIPAVSNILDSLENYLPPPGSSTLSDNSCCEEVKEKTDAILSKVNRLSDSTLPNINLLHEKQLTQNRLATILLILLLLILIALLLNKRNKAGHTAIVR